MKIYIVSEIVYRESNDCFYYLTEREALDAFYTRIGEYMLNPHYSELPNGMSNESCQIRKEWDRKEIWADLITVYSVELNSQKQTSVTIFKPFNS